MRVTLYICPLCEAEEIEMLPAKYPIAIHHFKQEMSRDRFNQAIMSDWIPMLEYRCNCGKKMYTRGDSKPAFNCGACGREWCRDIDNSICRITDDPAVLHELR